MEASPNTYSKVSFGATELLNYDLNGNIGGLSRRNVLGEEIDNLWYNLEGNRLKGVLDNSGRSEGFLDNGSAIDYSYDNAGNLTTDGNRGISIAYNALNLPRQVSINGKTIGYDYSASGQKVRMQNGTKTITYAGLLELDESNYVTRISTEEGQVIRKENDTLQYQLYLKDHLGNVRNVIDERGTLIQETEYYPFGLQINKTPTDWTQGYLKNRYLYNGKESQPETNWLDYGARMYMPEIGRWGTIDPKSELMRRWSTYQFNFNNPIRFIDPDGMMPEDPWYKKLWDRFLNATGMSTPESVEQMQQGEADRATGQRIARTINKLDEAQDMLFAPVSGMSTIKAIGKGQGGTAMQEASFEFIPLPGGKGLGKILLKNMDIAIDAVRKVVKNSSGGDVVRTLVKNEDDLLKVAENAAGGTLDSFNEVKTNWFEGKLKDGKKMRIEWQPGGEELMGEGPHVKVMQWDNNKGKKGGWRVMEKVFIEGKEKY